MRNPILILFLTVMAGAVFFINTAYSTEYFSNSFESGTVGDAPTYTDQVSGAGWRTSAGIAVVDHTLSSVTPHTGSKMLRFRWDGSSSGCAISSTGALKKP